MMMWSPLTSAACASALLWVSTGVRAAPLPSFVIGTECEADFIEGISPGGDVHCRTRIDVDGDGRAEAVSFHREYRKSRVEVTIKDNRSGTTHRFEKPTIDDLANEATKITFGLLKSKALGASIFMLDMPRDPSCDSGSKTYFLSYSPARGIQVAAQTQNYNGEVESKVSSVTFFPDRTLIFRERVEVSSSAMGPEEEEDEPEDQGYDLSVLKCLKEGVYGPCPKDKDRLRAGLTAYIQASSAAVRPAIASRDKATKLHIGDAVRVLKLEKAWAHVEGEGMKGWVELPLLGLRAPQVDQLLKAYQGVKPCTDPSKGLGCELDKLKERVMWAKRIAALQPQDCMGVERFVEALEQMLAAKLSAVDASKRARLAINQQLKHLRRCLKACPVSRRSDEDTMSDCLDEAERAHENALRRAGK